MWNKLYNAARKAQNNENISSKETGGVAAAAILTKQGNIYIGACIDTLHPLGICAENNAITNMITNSESQIEKFIVIMPNGQVRIPCNTCRKLMMQLNKNIGDIEVLVDFETKKSVKLKELVPNWWN